MNWFKSLCSVQALEPTAAMVAERGQNSAHCEKLTFHWLETYPAFRNMQQIQYSELATQQNEQFKKNEARKLNMQPSIFIIFYNFKLLFCGVNVRGEYRLLILVSFSHHWLPLMKPDPRQLIQAVNNSKNPQGCYQLFHSNSISNAEKYADPLNFSSKNI